VNLFELTALVQGLSGSDKISLSSLLLDVRSGPLYISRAVGLRQSIFLLKALSAWGIHWGDYFCIIDLEDEYG